MKQYLMTLSEKNSIIELTLTAAMAHKAFMTARNNKDRKETEAEMTALLNTQTSTFQALIDAVTNLDTNKLVELCHQFWFRLETDSWVLSEEEGKGHVWDHDIAGTIANAMDSLQTAVEKDGGQYKDDRNRVYTVKSRKDSAMSLAALFKATDVVPSLLNDDDVPGKAVITGKVVQDELSRLYKLAVAAQKRGQKSDSATLSALYDNTKKHLGWLINQKNRPQQRPTRQPTPNTFKLGEVLGVQTTEAAAEAPAAVPAADQAEPQPAKTSAAVDANAGAPGKGRKDTHVGRGSGGKPKDGGRRR